MGGANGQIGTVAGASRLRQWVGLIEGLDQWAGPANSDSGRASRTGDSGCDQMRKVGGTRWEKWAGPGY